MSTQTPDSPPPAMPSPLRLIATLGLIAMLSGFAIVLVYELTLEPIARNHRVALERAVFKVLPGAQRRVNYRLTETALEALPDEALGQANVFAGYTEDGRLVGVALEAAGRGYAGEIRVLYGYAPEQEAIIGYTVLQSSETPGLGDKIISDPHFLRNFEQLDVALDESGEALRHPIETVPQGQKSNPWEIDGLTGATVSSEAVGRALRESAQRFIPAIHRQRDQLTTPPEEGF